MREVENVPEVLIGLTGPRQNGKSTVAALLRQHFGCVTFAFADALREMAFAVNPIISTAGAKWEIVNHLAAVKHASGAPSWDLTEFRYDFILQTLGYDKAKESIPDFRGFLQRLGTEGVRGTFGPDAWVNALALRLDEPRATIADVRFLSEEEYVHRVGGRVWRILRPSEQHQDSHASEVEMQSIKADRTILNDGTLSGLEARVRAAFAEDFPTAL